MTRNAIRRHTERRRAALARKLSVLMLKRGLCGAELARRLDVTRAAVSNWTRGVALPAHHHQVALAAELGVPVAELAT